MNNFENQTTEFLNSNLGSVTTLESLLEDNTPAGFIDEPTPDNTSDLDVDLNTQTIEPESEPTVSTPTIEPEPTVNTPNVGVTLEGNVDFKEVVSNLIENGKFLPVDVIVTEDGTEIPFEEAEIDQQTFYELIDFQLKNVKEEALKNKIDSEGISDFTKKVIEIEKNGGNVSQAIQYFESLKNPLSQLDLGTEEGQEKSITMYLKNAKNMDDEMISAVIEGYKKNGLLDSKAEEAKAILDKSFSDYLEGLNQQAIDAKAAQVEALKKYKAELTEELKVNNVPEGLRKRLTDISSRRGEDNKFEMDNIYNQMRKDPKKAAELAFFLLDKEKYLEFKYQSKRVADDISTLAKFKLTRQPTSKPPVSPEDNTSSRDVDFNTLNSK